MKISANRSQLLFLSIVVQQWLNAVQCPPAVVLGGKTVTWVGSYTSHFHLEDRCNQHEMVEEGNGFFHFHLFSAVLEWFLSTGSS